jgi:hypothetical protein
LTFIRTEPGRASPYAWAYTDQEQGAFAWLPVTLPGLLQLEDESFDGGPSRRRQL